MDVQVDHVSRGYPAPPSEVRVFQCPEILWNWGQRFCAAGLCASGLYQLQGWPGGVLLRHTSKSDVCSLCRLSSRTRLNGIVAWHYRWRSYAIQIGQLIVVL
eukprot:350910-Chlamydomonas_euryale.AAC.7